MIEHPTQPSPAPSPRGGAPYEPLAEAQVLAAAASGHWLTLSRNDTSAAAGCVIGNLTAPRALPDPYDDFVFACIDADGNGYWGTVSTQGYTYFCKQR